MNDRISGCSFRRADPNVFAITTPHVSAQPPHQGRPESSFLGVIHAELYRRRANRLETTGIALGQVEWQEVLMNIPPWALYSVIGARPMLFGLPVTVMNLAYGLHWL